MRLASKMCMDLSDTRNNSISGAGMAGSARLWRADDQSIRPASLNVRFCEGFRMPAADERCHRHRRPASESLQGRKPRWGDVWQCRVRYWELRVARNVEAG